MKALIGKFLEAPARSLRSVCKCVCVHVCMMYVGVYLFYKILVVLNLLCVYVFGGEDSEAFGGMGKFLYLHARLLYYQAPYLSITNILSKDKMHKEFKQSFSKWQIIREQMPMGSKG